MIHTLSAFAFLMFCAGCAGPSKNAPTVPTDGRQINTQARASLTADSGELPGSVPELIAEGMRLWRLSCPISNAGELCLSMQDQESAINCTGAVSRVVRHKRDSRLVLRAQRYFEEVILRAESQHIPSQAVYAAQARFMVLEAEFEELMALEFPRGLDFSPHDQRAKEKSMRRFKSFISTASQMIRELQESYATLAHDTKWFIFGMARRVQVTERYGRLLETGEIPRDVRSGEYADSKRDAYCAELDDRASVLIELSELERKQCVARAARIGLSDDVCFATVPVP